MFALSKDSFIINCWPLFGWLTKSFARAYASLTKDNLSRFYNGNIFIELWVNWRLKKTFF